MIHVVKKDSPKTRDTIIIRLLAILGALLAASIIVIFAGANPIELYIGIIEGCFGNLYRFAATIQKMVPLLVLSLGVMVAFKMKFWNIGAEGQFLMGAVGAALVVRYLPNLPLPVMIFAMGVLAFVFGAIWLLIPAFFKAKFGTNETLFTLMMNYIALNLVVALQYDFWKDPGASGMPKIANFPDNALLPSVSGFNLSIAFAIILVILIYFLMNYSKIGFEITVLGESENTARYIGINITKTIITAALISGGLCGLVGMFQTAGISGALSVEITGGLGFTAIIVAWLSGLKVPFIVLNSFAFAVLLQGGSYIQTAFQIPGSVAEMIQAIILFFILGSEFALHYRFISDKKKREVA
ncbi:ABC transporter permease [Acetobacterium bakii]|uniref:Branched-chain amino acid ABC transporter permease n=1 Tax=Acetobacterium bakii TaxID=52689 RepID=A0A0L6TYT4_9FIRM|nr:ABC transporter permease [Acetobacterium bakii]KNZ41421.1 branched-chain amino acid ABC transporter permease [Acetobacterium bakii]